MRIIQYFLVSSFLAVTFGFFANAAFAADYYWTNLYGQGSFSDPLTACRSTHSSVESVGLNAAGTSASCYISGTSSIGQVYRYGDSCPVNTTYNPQTGVCDASEQNLCEQAAGASTTYSVPVSFDGSPPPDEVDVNGCLAKFGGVITCGVKTDGSAYCTGTATITGEETSASSPVAGPAAECTFNCTADFPQSESSDLACDPVTDPATGASLCTSESHFSDPGTMNCGTANGELVCTENPKSRSQDKVVETKTETSTNPDGSTTTTTTTKTDTENCLGVNNCTTSTSTQTSTGGTNADGSTKPDSSSCVGAGCEAPEDMPEEPTSSVSGEDCGVPVVCEGDAVACATLRQAKEQNCHLQEMNDYESVKTDIDNLFTGSEFQPDAETEIQIPSFISEGTRFMSPSCPAPESFSVLGRAFALEYTPLCNAAEAISPLLIIMAALSAALYIGRAFGGV